MGLNQVSQPKPDYREIFKDYKDEDPIIPEPTIHFLNKGEVSIATMFESSRPGVDMNPARGPVRFEELRQLYLPKLAQFRAELLLREFTGSELTLGFSIPHDLKEIHSVISERAEGFIYRQSTAGIGLKIPINTQESLKRFLSQLLDPEGL